MNGNPQSIVPSEVIIGKIYLIRDQKVMLDSDLAELYQVETKRVNEQVGRNIKRFPDDFMFQLNSEEWESLKSQNATSNMHGGRRTPPFVFTEHGVLMLSSVLKSERAVEVNIQIMRIYIRLREMVLTNHELLVKVERLESKLTGHGESIKQIFAYLRELLNPPGQPGKNIGYRK